MTPYGGKAVATGYKPNLCFYYGPTHGTYDPRGVGKGLCVSVCGGLHLGEKIQLFNCLEVVLCVYSVCVHSGPIVWIHNV